MLLLEQSQIFCPFTAYIQWRLTDNSNHWCLFLWRIFYVWSWTDGCELRSCISKSIDQLVRYTTCHRILFHDLCRTALRSLPCTEHRSSLHRHVCTIIHPIHVCRYHNPSMYVPFSPSTLWIHSPWTLSTPFKFWWCPVFLAMLLHHRVNVEIVSRVTDSGLQAILDEAISPWSHYGNVHEISVCHCKSVLWVTSLSSFQPSVGIIDTINVIWGLFSIWFHCKINVVSHKSFSLWNEVRTLTKIYQTCDVISHPEINDIGFLVNKFSSCVK